MKTIQHTVHTHLSISTKEAGKELFSLVHNVLEEFFIPAINRKAKEIVISSRLDRFTKCQKFAQDV